MISDTFPWQHFVKEESYFKIDHRVTKLLSVEVFNNISKLQSNITMKLKAIKMSMCLRKRLILLVFVYSMLFESYRVTTKFISSIWYTESFYQQFIFQIFLWS